MTQTWSNSTALSVTRVCVCVHVHACTCVYVYTGGGKLPHLLWVISKLHKSLLWPPRVCHIPSTPPLRHLKLNPHGGQCYRWEEPEKVWEPLVELYSLQILPHPLFWDCPPSHQIFTQHLLCSRCCARHWESRSDQNQTQCLESHEAHSLEDIDISKLSEKGVLTVHSTKCKNRKLYGAVELITRSWSITTELHRVVRIKRVYIWVSS